MPLVLAQLEQKKSWQPVQADLPAEVGFELYDFEALWLVPDAEKFLVESKELTIKELVEKYLQGLRGIQETPDSDSEVEVSKKLMTSLIKNNFVLKGLFFSLRDLVNGGGKLKN